MSDEPAGEPVPAGQSFGTVEACEQYLPGGQSVAADPAAP